MTTCCLCFSVFKSDCDDRLRINLWRRSQVTYPRFADSTREWWIKNEQRYYVDENKGEGRRLPLLGQKSNPFRHRELSVSSSHGSSYMLRRRLRFSVRVDFVGTAAASLHFVYCVFGALKYNAVRFSHACRHWKVRYLPSYHKSTRTTCMKQRFFSGRSQLPLVSRLFAGWTLTVTICGVWCRLIIKFILTLW